MPSKTAKQARTMAAAAHNPAFARKLGIPQGVAREFNQADKGRAMDNKAYAKGGDVRAASYASGGAVTGRTKDFMKTPDTFRTDKERQDYGSKSGAKPASKSPKDKSTG